jgi:S-DNA-T family DNA segregation ATPase FtsK/SpoIIIE
MKVVHGIESADRSSAPAPAGRVLPAQRLRLPPPVARDKTGFPTAAVVGPLVAAGGFWLITRSPYALALAALSPVTAMFFVVDAAWRARRARAGAHRSRSASLDDLRRTITATHRQMLQELRRRTPSAAALLNCDASADPGRWRARPDTMRVVVGTGILPSGLTVEGEPCGGDETRLCAEAARLADAPITALAVDGIAVCGPPAMAWSVARALLVQLTHRLSPAEVRLEAPRGHAPVSLPHCESTGAVSSIVVIDATDGACARVGLAAARGSIRIVVCDRLERVPPVVCTILRLRRPGIADVLRPGAAPQRVCVEHVGEAQWTEFALALRRHATQLGIVAGTSQGDVLLEHLPEGDATGLGCAVGIPDDPSAREQGVFRVDLAHDGPHAVVGGTTGSGKSELLTTWVAAMARTRSPRDVSFLLIDFKGGAAFAPLGALPHCVGVITDLDETGARRAVASLGAEMRRRERVLAAAGAAAFSDIAGRGLLARLVIVVDEFQSMLQQLPDFETIFTDIAARGRSLGVHLILCTQRPSGVVREALMANCGLRLCLRVHAKADSQAVIGDARAAALPSDRPGRCLIGQTGAAQPVQIALTSAAEIARIVARHRAESVARRPWLEPLPDRISLHDLTGSIRGRPEEATSEPGSEPSGILLGMIDDPAMQRQYPARYDPQEDGPLLCVADAGAGKTTLLQTICRQIPHSTIVSGVEECWDAVRHAAEACLHPHGPGSGMILLDDLDALLARFDDDYAHEFAESLALVLREGPPRFTVVATCRRLTGRVNAVADLFTERIFLRMKDRSEFAMAGGDTSLHDPLLAPGGGSWRGRRVQVAVCAEPGGTPRRRGQADLTPVDLSGGALIVSRHPAATADHLRAGDLDVVELDPGSRVGGLGVTSGTTTIIVADPETWQSALSLLTAREPRLPIVFEACTPADVRLITHRRVLPPVLEPYRGHVWVLGQDDRVHRGVLAGRV